MITTTAAIVVVVVIVGRPSIVVVDVEVVISIVNGSVTADSHNCPIEIL